MATKAQNYKAKVSALKKYKTVPHNFNKKVFNWFYCSGCGLVTLKNESTRKRMAQTCESMED